MSKYTNVNTGYSRVLPVWETLNLAINGSATAVVPQKSVYTWERMIWYMDWNADAVNWDLFGGEATALTNGMDIYIYGTKANDQPLKTNGDFFKYGYDVTVVQDTRSPKGSLLTARWSFNKYTPKGIVSFLPDTDFYIMVNDDQRIATLTSFHSIQVVLQGWQFAP